LGFYNAKLFNLHKIGKYSKEIGGKSEKLSRKSGKLRAPSNSKKGFTYDKNECFYYLIY